MMGGVYHQQNMADVFVQSARKTGCFVEAAPLLICFEWDPAGKTFARVKNPDKIFICRE